MIQKSGAWRHPSPAPDPRPLAPLFHPTGASRRPPLAPGPWPLIPSLLLHLLAARALAGASCLTPWTNALFLSRLAAAARAGAALLGRPRTALAFALAEGLLLARALHALLAALGPRPFDRDRSLRCPLGPACCRHVPPPDPLLPAPPVRCPLPPLAAGLLLAAAAPFFRGRAGAAAVSPLLSLFALPFAARLARAGRRSG